MFFYAQHNKTVVKVRVVVRLRSCFGSLAIHLSAKKRGVVRLKKEGH